MNGTHSQVLYALTDPAHSDALVSLPVEVHSVVYAMRDEAQKRERFQSLSQEEVAALPTTDLTSLSEVQLGSISSEQMKTLTEDQIADMSDDQVRLTTVLCQVITSDVT